MAAVFRFMTSVQAVQLTGVRAGNLAELFAALRDVDGSSVYHHTHRFYRTHSFLGETPLSDFAFWVGENLKEAAVAERMAAVDPRDFATIRELRNALLAAIEPMREMPDRWERRVPPGLEFHFCRSVSLVLPTGREAKNLEEFVEALEHVDTTSLYHHLIEAPLHLDGERPYRNDLSDWLASALGATALADAVAALNPYRKDLEGLRRDLVAIFRPRRFRRMIASAASRQEPVSGLVSSWLRRWRGGA
jgi:hypothetical protein